MTVPAQQLRVFLAMALCGAALGMAYDALGWVRKILLRKEASGALGDLLFGALCAGCIIFMALHLRTDAFRGYTLLGAGLGMGVYAITLGRILRAVQTWAAGIWGKFARRGRNLTK